MRYCVYVDWHKQKEQVVNFKLLCHSWSNPIPTNPGCNYNYIEIQFDRLKFAQVIVFTSIVI